MKRRNLTRRLDELDGGHGVVHVTISILGCATQEEYDIAFNEACEQVPSRAVVFVFPKLSEEEWLTEAARELAGLPPLIDHRCGIYLKGLEAE